MARITKSKHKLCRRERFDLFPRLGDTAQVSKRLSKRTPPGEHLVYPRMSSYASQLREKQTVKRMYGLMERQFRRFFQMASRKGGQVGLTLLQLLELRLDNFVFRAGMAKTRDQARQLVNHGHVLVDGKKVDIPSYVLKVGQKVTLKDKIVNLSWFEELRKLSEAYQPPSWIRRDNVSDAAVVGLPKREDIDPSIREQYIVEFYSK